MLWEDVSHHTEYFDTLYVLSNMIVRDDFRASAGSLVTVPDTVTKNSIKKIKYHILQKKTATQF